jgi:flagellar basal-body rod modification protein FlgD
MAEINSIAAYPTRQDSGTASPVSRQQGAELGTDTFLKLMVAQMRHQDPFSGGQGGMQDFLAQLAQFSMLERLVKVQQTLEDFHAQQAPLQALRLLDTTVEVMGGDGARTQGKVTAVRFADGLPLLTVQGMEYPLSAVIRAGSLADAAGP